MNNQSLIIYNFNSLYHIFEELDLELNFRVINIKNENLLHSHIKSLTNYLIICKENSFNLRNQIIIDNLPIKFSKLLEKINIEFLKLQFNNQSQIIINNYIINLNSREMSFKDIKLKLTEKEINTIIYLKKFSKPVGINELQKSVWGYSSGIETHTVETHIYRLRKKILNIFGDDNFIISEKDGYKIK